MENNKEFKNNSKEELKNTPFNKLKVAPKPEPKSFKENLKLLRDKALGIINAVVDYTLDNFQELYNTATNSFPKNEFKPHQKQEPILLNESFVNNELINKAKQENDTKEVYLNNKHPSNQNMVGSSLVVDMDMHKVEATIKSLHEKLNSNILENPEINVDAKKDKKEVKSDINDKIKDNKSQSAPKPVSKLKPEPPKPSPKNSSQKKKEKKIDSPKPTISLNEIQANIDGIRNRFMKNQQEYPNVLEEQKYETVLKPQDPVFKIRNKESVGDNIALLRVNSMAEPIPDVVEDSYGVEQRKIKARLK